MSDDAEKGEPQYDIQYAEEYMLTEIEKSFILAAERGDLQGVKAIINDNQGQPDKFNINCVDPMNRSALISAIENENYDLIIVLLEAGIQVGDALLHAISEEYVEAVEELLQWEEQNHKPGTPYSWEAVDRAKSTFTVDITPLILAAHRNNYEILKILLDRGATLPMPHDVKCGCDECVTSQETDSLRHSQARINAYRALSASSLIALSSRDPVLSAFELAWELKRLQSMESEFRAEYSEMRLGVQQFATSLLDHVRTSTELEVMLNYNHEPSNEIWTPGKRQTLDRLKLAVRFKQKTFVSHPNVQQLLAAIWYEGLPGFRRKTASQQIIEVVKLGCMFPINSMNYLMCPESDAGKFMKKPFVKFISHSCSYMVFLMLLGAASLRIVPIMFELLAFPWMLEMLEDWRKHERGSLPGPIELGIITYIGSLVFGELKALYSDGIFEYIADLWNIVDFISNMFYVTWILCRATAWIVVHRDLWFRNLDPYFPREHWHPFDPMLLSEGAFAAGMVFSYLKLVHIFSINPHLGPLQVSLGRMIIDIIKFFFIYTLVLFAFGCGLNQLLWYYAELEQRKCYHLHPDVADFDDQEKACTIWRRFSNLFETSQSLFWASFGLVDLVSFDLAGIKSFTRFWALLMFGSYSVINIIVLLNMLIAMMSNSYQIISERADVEWKFARSQLWISYFEDGGTVPPPFNMVPSVKLLKKAFGKVSRKRSKSFMRKSMEKAMALHEKVMKLLIRRYVTAEQKRRDDFGITEDDIIEVRQDISSLRFELLEIFQNNNYEVPDIEKKTAAAVNKKGKVMERRILKDFQIGFVENIKEEMTEGTDIFTSIAKAMNKRKAQKGEKDWNAIMRKNTLGSNPIGTKRSSMKRLSQRSLRRHIIETANEGLRMDQSTLIEYNPNLTDVSRATRVAYVKFMKKKLEADETATEQQTDQQTEQSVETTDERRKTMKRGQTKKAEIAKPPDANKKEDAKPPPTADKSKPPAPNAAPKPGGGPAPPNKPEGSAAKPGVTKPGETSKPPAAGAKKEESAKPAPSPAGPAKGAAPSAPGKPDANAKPASDATKPPADSSAKPTDGEDKKTAEKKTDDKKPEDKKPTDKKPEDIKSGDKKPDDKKPDDKKSDEKKPDDKKPEDKKPDDKKSDKKAEDKKPKTNLGQSSAAAGGDRGKSTVTGRMISGWL
ncbi:transient receptor potential protein [Stomoxys calcitrans]|uniref:Transient receptor ion channel domain-containing protein n=1 Tax=Stomoxys calcitrans TaxID=35570 RepID=A0A1I8PGE5_STOCA|nr:transient receptor potential protein [Stomoxys calcitrans]XP_059218472.1 transient receptor potential protein [Stomoxys calcitrans]XP_059218473.1 transient receptor potential protein [Stomoxys calcitrans]